MLFDVSFLKRMARLNKSQIISLFILFFIALSVPLSVYLASFQQNIWQQAAGMNPVTPVSLNLTATYNSVGIEVPFSDDNNGNATASLEFKKSSDTSWRKGLDLHRTSGNADGLKAPIQVSVVPSSQSQNLGWSLDKYLGGLSIFQKVLAQIVTPTATPTLALLPTDTPVPTSEPTPTSIPTQTPILTSIPTNTPIPLVTSLPSPDSFIFTSSADYGDDGDLNPTANMQPPGIGPKLTLMGTATASAAFNFAIGDFSYKASNPANIPLWCQYVKDMLNLGAGKPIGDSFGANFPFYLVNGDNDGAPGASYLDYLKPGCMDARPPGMVGNYGLSDYYFDYPQTNPLARIIAIPGAYTKDYTWGLGNPEYIKLSNTIDDARARNIKWVIIGIHEPCISMSTHNCQFFGEDLMNLIVAKKVDLVLQGHDHNYQRTKQLALSPACSAFQFIPKTYHPAYNPACVVDDGSGPYFEKNKGTIFNIVGTAGRSFYQVYPGSEPAKYMAKYMGINDGTPSDDVNGFVKFTVSSSELKAEFIPNIPGRFTDTYVIKDTGLVAPSPNPITPPPPLSGAFYGSVLDLPSAITGELYNIKITITDPDGVSCPASLPVGITCSVVSSLELVLESTKRTRADDTASASSLSPTHFISTNGKDSNDGSTKATAWRTLERAWKDAPANAVVEVSPGYYVYPSHGTMRSLPITIKAQSGSEAVDNNRNIINQGNHVVIQDGEWSDYNNLSLRDEKYYLSSPQGTPADSRFAIAPWTQVTLAGTGLHGAPVGASYTVWKWTGAPTASSAVTYMGYHASRADAPTRIPHWDPVGTPADWAEAIYTNKLQQFGFLQSGSDLYLRLPKDLNPNDHWISYGLGAGSGYGFLLDAPNVRLSGLELRGITQAISIGASGRTVGTPENAKSIVVDHNLFVSGNFATNGYVDTRSILHTPSDITVENNRFVDSSLWSDDQVNKPSINWTFIKGYLIWADGSSGPRVGTKNETSAISGRNGAQRVVIRNNTIDGFFNGIAPGGMGTDSSGPGSRYYSQDMDIYGNEIMHVNDDAIEPEMNKINFRVWNNKVHDSSVFLSVAPVNYGPVYVFRNQIWNLGVEGSANALGQPLQPMSVAIKIGMGSSPDFIGKLFFVNNTIWTDSHIASVNGAEAMGAGVSNPTGTPMYYWFRNNIFRTYNRAIDLNSGTNWDENYNFFGSVNNNENNDANSKGAGGVKIKSIKSFYSPNLTGLNSISDYRTLTGQGANTNKIDNQDYNFVGTDPFSGQKKIDEQLVNPLGGNFFLKANSLFVDMGVVVPNISDNYGGNGPDIGAIESSYSRIIPPTTTPGPTAIPTPTPIGGIPTATPTTPPIGGGPTSVPTGVPVTIPFRIDSGNLATDTVDSFENTWNKDSYFTGGNTGNAGSVAITNTADDFIYQTIRWAANASYAIPIANGNYTLNLHFAETSKTAAGQRVFSVNVEGAPIISNLDIFQEASGRNIALVKSVPVTVSDGVLNISVTAGVDQPFISGLEILPALTGGGPSTVPTPTPTPAPIGSGPTPVPCSIAFASWGQTTATPGQAVNLNVTTAGDCSGKQVNFEVWENDSVLEGVMDESVTLNPQPVSITGTSATATWTAEYQEDGFFGMFDPPEYFFKATIGGDISTEKRSSDPLLEVPKQSVPSSPNQVQAGAMNLSATFNSIGIELLFTGDDNANSTATLEFKKSADSAWRKGLDIWRTDDGSTIPGRAFYGSALLLDDNTDYDIRIGLADPDGVSGTAFKTATIKTRADNIPKASTLTPTHYVRGNGNDATGDGSLAKPWQSIQKAVSTAPAESVIQVGPGYYNTRWVSLNKPITLLAQYPAVDDNRNIINDGQRTILDWGDVALTTPESNAWQQVTLRGPATGTDYTIWKLANTQARNGNYGPGYLGFASSRDAIPRRLGNWDIKSGTVTDKSGKVWTMSTPEGWTELLYNNKEYNYGWRGHKTTNGQLDLYLRMPGDLNPNNYYLFQGGISKDSGTPGYTFFVSGAGARISGFQITGGGGITLKHPAAFATIDHNLLAGGGVNMAGTAGNYGSDHVIEYNLIKDIGLWSDIHDSVNEALPWCFIKCGITLPDGTGTWGRIGAGSETSGVSSNGGAHRVVIRHNTIDGPFNGISDYNTKADRYAEYNQDIHDNVIKHISDDALEPEGGLINWRIWNNWIEQTGTVMSTGPVSYGPVYMFRNQIWKTGRDGVGRTNNGDPAIGSVFFKMSGSSQPTARIYVLHNTFWADDPTGVSASGQFAGGGPYVEAYYSKNNIMRSTRYAGMPSGLSSLGVLRVEADNYWATTDTTRGYFRNLTDVQKYRNDYKTATGLDTNTNVGWDSVSGKGSFIDTNFVDNALIDPTSGNLSLKASAPFINTAAPIPNISDNLSAKSAFSGSAPDLGALEFGTTSWVPPTTSPTSTLSSPTPSSVLTPTRTPTPTLTPTPTPMPTPVVVQVRVVVSSLVSVVRGRVTMRVRVRREGEQAVVVNVPNIDVETNTLGEQTFTLPALLPSTYEMFVKVRGHLQKKVSFVHSPLSVQLTISLVAGDVNNDGRINALDIGRVIEDYTQTTSSPADLNLDGVVNAQDIGFVLNNYLQKEDLY